MTTTERRLLRILSVAAAMALAAAGPVKAQAPAPADQSALAIDIESAVMLALKSNLGIETEGVNLDVKRRAKDTMWNVFIPKMNLGGSLAYPTLFQSPSRTLVGVAGGNAIYYTPDKVFTLAGSLSASLSLTTQIYYGMQAAMLDYENGLISLETARKKLDRDVRKAFLNLLLLEENLKLLRKNLATAVTRYEQATANFRSGLVDEYSMLAAQVVMENLKPAIEELRNGYESALLSFKALLGLDFERVVRLSGSIEPSLVKLDARKLIGENLQNRLDVQALKLSLRLLDNARDLAESSKYPYLSFILSFDPTFQKDPFKDAWFSSTFDSDWKQRSGMLGVTVTVPLDPWIPDSQANVNVANSRSNIEKTRLALAQALQGAELEVRSLVLKLAKSEQAMKTLALNLQLAEKATALGQEAYKAGVKDLSQIENTELQLNQAQFDILKEKFNYASGIYDLAYALNISLEKIMEAGRE